MEDEKFKILKKENFSDEITDEFYFNLDYKNEPKLGFKGKGIYQNNEHKVGGYRYYLEISIEDNNDKVLTVIMQNPADTFPDFVWDSQVWINKNIINKNGKKRPVSKGFDKTVRNVIRIAKASGFSKVVVLNTFSLVQANGNNAHKEYDEKNEAEVVNKNFVCDYLENSATDLLIAWGFGTKINIDCYLESILKNENIKLWAYAWNKNRSCPFHPSQQVDNRFGHVVRKFIKKPILIPLKIDKRKLCRANQDN